MNELVRARVSLKLSQSIKAHMLNYKRASTHSLSVAYIKLDTLTHEAKDILAYNIHIGIGMHINSYLCAPTRNQQICAHFVID